MHALPVDMIESPQIVYRVSLGELEKDIPYKISCTIQSGSKDTILFEPRLLSSGQYGRVKINHNAIPDNRGRLVEGKNLLSFNLLLNKEDKSSYNQFSLSSPESIQIEGCTAQQPSQPPKKGFICDSYLWNETDSAIDFKVGVFFPIFYTVKPHDYKCIFNESEHMTITHIR